MHVKTRSYVDFNHVEPHQMAIDARLKNWALWCNSGWGIPYSSPMFRMTPHPPRVRGDIDYQSRIVDKADAAKIAMGVRSLPEKNRKAINWAYVHPTSPARAMLAIGVGAQALHDLLFYGREMLLESNI